MHSDFGIVFASGEFANTVYSYVLGATEELTFSASAPVPDQPYAIAVDRSRQFVFVSNIAANAIRHIFTFRIGLGGVLGLVNTSPALALSRWIWRPDPIGPYLYQVNTFAEIEGYNIAPNGSFTSIGTFPGVGRRALAPSIHVQSVRAFMFLR